jgi:hypothetical protein
MQLDVMSGIDRCGISKILFTCSSFLFYNFFVAIVGDHRDNCHAVEHLRDVVNVFL